MLRELINNKDYSGIELALANHPEWANDGLEFDDANGTKAHPLHRICDAVFLGKLNDDEAVQIAKIFLLHGANINGDGLVPKKDTPLIAAASLGADEVAICYIDSGADIHHAGTHGGTALHWAAWCGRVNVVKRLIDEGADVNQLCIDFKSTPLYWAVHGIKKNGEDRQPESLECVHVLLSAGADINIPNAEGRSVYDLLNEDDTALKKLLNTI